LGGLDILINNVLPLPDIAPVEQQTTEAFKAAFNRIECAAMAMAASIWPIRFWISADSVDVRDQSPEQRHPLPPRSAVGVDVRVQLNNSPLAAFSTAICGGAKRGPNWAANALQRSTKRCTP